MSPAGDGGGWLATQVQARAWREDVVHGKRKPVVEARDWLACVDSRGLAHPHSGKHLPVHFAHEAVRVAEAQLVAQRRREDVVDELCLAQPPDLDFAALDRVFVHAFLSRLEHLAAKPAVVQLERSPRTLAIPPLVWHARLATALGESSAALPAAGNPAASC
eukprot:scaffold24009_cov68-Phaeocystis_antarctica.AAC.3